MGISKPHPLRCELVDMRRLDFRIRIVTGQITHPEIVGEDVHDVGMICGGHESPGKQNDQNSLHRFQGKRAMIEIEAANAKETRTGKHSSTSGR